jgi:hypothetical protein
MVVPPLLGHTSTRATLLASDKEEESFGNLANPISLMETDLAVARLPKDSSSLCQLRGLCHTTIASHT